MDENGENLTPEEEELKARLDAEDEDPNTQFMDADELPRLIPIPTSGDVVVAEFIPLKKEK